MPFKDPEKKKEFERVYHLNRYHRRREEALSRLGGCCAACGSVENLEFDHIDPETKIFTIAKMWSFSEAKFWAEVAKCQVLCHDCHIEKSRMNQEFSKNPVHGSSHPLSKITEDDIPVIRDLLASGVSHQKIADQFEVSRGLITQISSGRAWKHVLQQGAVL